MTDSSNTDCALSVTGPYESTAIVTGPMPRNPNATRPNANTGARSHQRAEAGPSSDVVGNAHQRHDAQPEPVGAEVAGDEAGQDVERRAAFPATKLTTSLTCADSVDVKTFTNSGMMAPASVPHVMTVDSFHHSVPSPRSGMSR